MNVRFQASLGPQDARKPASPESAAEAAKPPSSWSRMRVASVAVAGLAVLSGVYVFAHAGADSTPKRWLRVAETESRCYADLIAPSPQRTDCVQPDDAPIPSRYNDWVRPHVAVYTAAAAPHSLPTLRDLGDRGQAEAIRFLESDADGKSRDWNRLEDTLKANSDESGETDPYRFERVLVANVAEGVDWKPGDRMMWTRVLIQPINFTFAGYTVAETDNETQKVSSVEDTRSRKFTADLSATIPGMEGPKAELGPSSEHTVKTSSDINAQYEKLGVDIMPQFLRIIRESQTGGDAVGNTKISLTAATDADMIWKQYPGDSLAREAGEDPIVLLVRGVRFPDDGAAATADDGKPAVDILPQAPVPHCALRARVWMLYELRRVERGRESYDESKQSVTLVHEAEDKQDIDIMSADEVSPAVWSLKLCPDSRCRESDGHVLKAVVQPRLADDPAAWRKVVFTDYGVAIRLAHWLRTHPGENPPHTRYAFNFPSDSTDGAPRKYVSLVPSKTSRDECKDQSLLQRLIARLASAR